MAAEVVPLRPVLAPPGPADQTPDQSYWRTFKSQLLIPSPQSAPITHISTPQSFYSNAAPTTIQSSDSFALTSGTRITLLSTRTRRTTKTITRITHNDTAHSGEIRRDGRIVLASGDSGAIQAFDASSRAVLKTWREHKQPVWAVRWSPSALTELLSASDDRSVRLWDLPAEESKVQLYGHEDYVRSAGYVDSGGKVLVSGSYDRTVRVWDARSGSAVMRFDFADPVECVLPLPDGGSVAAAAAEKIAVLDLAGRRVREVVRNHQKTVTCLGLASQGRRVVSGGLDGHVKIFDTAEWKVVAGFKYPSPVLSVGVIPAGPEREGRHLAVGMQSGLLSIRTRLSGEQKTIAREKEKEMKALAEGTIEIYDKKKRKLRQGDKKRLRGKDYTGEEADIVIEGNVRGKIRNSSKWESALRKGQWQNCLDIILRQTPPHKQDLLTLFTALHHRSALRTSLQGRDETTLAPLMKFLTKHINDPRYVKLLSNVALILLDIYAPQMGGDDRGEMGIDALVAALHRKVRHSVEMAKMAGSTSGMLDFVSGEA